MKSLTLFYIPSRWDMPDFAELMTTEDVAKTLNLHVVTIRNMIRTKKLEGVKISGKTGLVFKSSVSRN